MVKDIRGIENLHVMFWLIKDYGWVQDIHILGIVMVVPTLTIAIWLAWRMRTNRSELAHNLATCCWIIANSVWMVGEFFFDDGTRPLATLFFALGILSLLVYYSVLLISKLQGKTISQ